MSTTSTAAGEEDDDDDLESSPALPSLPAPRLPARALELLRTPPGEHEDVPFGTAAWGSPYPQTDQNLRRLSFSSEASDDSPIHQLAIDTPFLRRAPELAATDSELSPVNVSSAAAILANRVRRQNRGLTEDWIRTHTAGDENTEPRLWFSDGSDSEHSSLSGSNVEGPQDSERSQRTPKANPSRASQPRNHSRHRGASSIDTLKPGRSVSLRPEQIADMSADAVDMAAFTGNSQVPSPQEEVTETWPVVQPSEQSNAATNGEPELAPLPATPTKKPLPKAPAVTPRLKKKIPWKGKNIMILLPRDDERGRPGQAPRPLREHEIKRMFASWDELGYRTDGFDLLVEGYQPQGTDDSQTRDAWPNFDDVVHERHKEPYKVILPDLNCEY